MDGDDNSHDDGQSIQQFQRLLQQESIEGKSYWALTVETLRMWDPKDKKSDVTCKTAAEALEALQMLVLSHSGGDKEKMAGLFSSTPLSDFDATVEDLMMAFVMWSRNSTESKGTITKDRHESKHGIFNVSKAYRRLKSYQEWMERNVTGIDVHAKSFPVEDIHLLFQIKVTHDKDGRLALFCDSTGWEREAYQKASPEHMMRYLCWLSHLIMFDKGTQENGTTLVYSLAGVQLMDCVTSRLVPIELQQKIDRLTLGTLPIRVQSVLLLNNPTWIRVVLAMFRPFLSKKITERIIVTPQTADVVCAIEEKVGNHNIPKGFAGFEGSVVKDLVQEKLEICCSD